LSNSISEKHRKYVLSYASLDHVREKSFVIAVASFDQPFFFLSCQRPIEAVLHGYYVDEDRYTESQGREGGLLANSSSAYSKTTAVRSNLASSHRQRTATLAPLSLAVVRRSEKCVRYPPIQIREFFSRRHGTTRTPTAPTSLKRQSGFMRRISWTGCGSITIRSLPARLIQRYFEIADDGG
jgi:hypothetical protein